MYNIFNGFGTANTIGIDQDEKFVNNGKTYIALEGTTYNYTLLKNMNSIDDYVVASHMIKNENGISWNQGYYFDNNEEAKTFYDKISLDQSFKQWHYEVMKNDDFSEKEKEYIKENIKKENTYISPKIKFTEESDDGYFNAKYESKELTISFKHNEKESKNVDLLIEVYTPENNYTDTNDNYEEEYNNIPLSEAINHINRAIEKYEINKDFNLNFSDTNLKEKINSMYLDMASVVEKYIDDFKFIEKRLNNNESNIKNNINITLKGLNTLEESLNTGTFSKILSNVVQNERT